MRQKRVFGNLHVFIDVHLTFFWCYSLQQGDSLISFTVFFRVDVVNNVHEIATLCVHLNVQ